ncbi:MAG: dockerin type I domain-containing protein, partial [Candidatus Omnitrophota bacterium]
VWVDGDYYGEISAPADRGRFRTCSVRAELAEGIHFVEFRAVTDSTAWIWYGNKKVERQIQVGKVFALNAADLNADKIVDTKDSDIYSAVMGRIAGGTATDPQDFIGLTDLNADGVTDQKDADIFLQAQEKMPDMDGDTDKDADDKDLVEAIAASANLFGAIEKADLNGDGMIGQTDLALIKASLLTLYYQLDVSAEEKALSDINKDGVIDYADIKLLEQANESFSRADLNGDGIVNRVDLEMARDLFAAVYSQPVLTMDVAGFGGTIARADLTGPDVNGDGIGDKDGIIDAQDIAILNKAMQDMQDVDGDGDFDTEDYGWAQRILTLALVIETSDLSDSELTAPATRRDLDGDGTWTEKDDVWAQRVKFMRGEVRDLFPGLSVDSMEVFAFLEKYGVISIDYDSVSSELINTSFNIEPQGMKIVEHLEKRKDPGSLPGWVWDPYLNQDPYNPWAFYGPNAAEYIPGWEIEGRAGWWIIEDGKLRQKLGNMWEDISALEDIVFTAKDVVFADNTVSFDVTIGEPQHAQERALAGAEFRIKEEGFYRVLVEKEYSTGAWIARFEKVAGENVTILDTQEVTIQPHVKAHFEIDAEGDHFMVWMDDELILECVDTGAAFWEGGLRFVTGPTQPAAFGDIKLLDKLDVSKFWMPVTTTSDYVQNEVKITAKEGTDNFILGDRQMRFSAQLEDSPYSKAGVEFRVTGDDFYRVVVERDYETEGWAAKLIKSVAGEFSTVASQAIQVDVASPMLFEVDAVGDVIKVWIDNALLFEYHDAEPLGEGLMRLFTGHISPAEFSAVWVGDNETFGEGWLPDDYEQKDVRITCRDLEDKTKDFVFEDRSMTFSAQLEDTPYSKAGCEFRVSEDGEDYYRVIVQQEFSTATAGDWSWVARLEKCVAGEFTTLASSDVAINTAAPTVFDVDAVGELLRVSVDGNPVLETVDETPLTSGSLRLITGHISPAEFSGVYVRRNECIDEAWIPYDYISEFAAISPVTELKDDVGNRRFSFNAQIEDAQDSKAGAEFNSYRVLVMQDATTSAWTGILQKSIDGEYSTLVSQNITLDIANYKTSFEIDVAGGYVRVWIADEGTPVDENDPLLEYDDPDPVVAGGLKLITGRMNPAQLSDAYVYENDEVYLNRTIHTDYYLDEVSVATAGQNFGVSEYGVGRIMDFKIKLGDSPYSKAGVKFGGEFADQLRAIMEKDDTGQWELKIQKLVGAEYTTLASRAVAITEGEWTDFRLQVKGDGTNPQQGTIHISVGGAVLDYNTQVQINPNPAKLFTSAVSPAEFMDIVMPPLRMEDVGGGVMEEVIQPYESTPGVATFENVEINTKIDFDPDSWGEWFGVGQNDILFRSSAAGAYVLRIEREFYDADPPYQDYWYGVVRLFKKEGYTYTEFDCSASTNWLSSNNEKNIRIVALGNSIKVYIDGFKMFDVTDGTHTSGTVGLSLDYGSDMLSYFATTIGTGTDFMPCWVSDSASDWQITSGSIGVWQMASDGTDIRYNGFKRLDDFKSNIHDPDFTDGTIESRAWIGHMPGWAAADEYPAMKTGVEFRVTGTDDYYALVVEEFTTTGTWEARIDKFASGMYDSTLVSQDVTALMQNDAWADFRIYASGGDIKAWINSEGDPVLECTDLSPILQGGIRTFGNYVVIPVSVSDANTYLYTRTDESFLPSTPEDWVKVYGTADWQVSSDGNTLDYTGDEIVDNISLDVDNVTFADGIIKSKAWFGEEPAWLSYDGDLYTTTGIDFRVTGTNDYYSFIVEETKEGQWEARVDKYIAGEYTGQVCPAQDVTAIIQGLRDTWASIRLYATGGDIKVWINNEMILEGTDTGTVIAEGGLRVFSDHILLPFGFEGYLGRNSARFYIDDAWLPVRAGDYVQHDVKVTAKDRVYNGTELIFDDHMMTFGAQLADNPYSKAACEFRKTGSGDHYRVQVSKEYSTLSPGDWAWVARLEKSVAGEYTTLDEEVVSINTAETTLFMLEAEGGTFKLWVDGALALAVEDADPIEEGTLSFVTGHVSPVTFSNAYILAENYFDEGWLPETTADDYAQEEVKITARDLIDNNVDLVFGDRSMTFSAQLEDNPFSMAGCEFRVTDSGDYYRVMVEKEYSTVAGWEWKAKLLKYASGEYTTLASKVVSINVSAPTVFDIFAEGGKIKVWIDGLLALDGEDASPIVEGDLRFVTGRILPAEFSDVRVHGGEFIDEGWLPAGDDRYIQRDVRIQAGDLLAGGSTVNFQDRRMSFSAQLADDPYSKAGVEFRVTETDDHYRAVVEKEYSTATGQLEWAAKLEKFQGGEYTTMDAENVTIDTAGPTSFVIDAVGRYVRVWIDGALVLEAEDSSPIETGTARFITGCVLPAEFSDLKIYEASEIDNEWLPEMFMDDYIQTDVKIVAADIDDSSADLVFDDRSMTFSVLLEDDPYSRAGVELRVTEDEDYYKVAIAREYSTVAAGDWAWVAKLDKYSAGEYEGPLGSADVDALVGPLVSAGYSTSLKIDAVGGFLRVFIEGIQVIGVEDTEPIEEGALRFFTGRISPAEISDVLVEEAGYITEGWLATDPAYYAENETKFTPADPDDPEADLVSGDGRIAFSAQLEDNPFSKAGCEFKATGVGDYYRVIVEQEYSTVSPGEWAWVAKLDRYVSGEYFTTLDSQPVTIDVASPTSFAIDTYGEAVLVWIDGELALEGTDDEPILEGSTRFVTGKVFPADFSGLRLDENVSVAEGWLPFVSQEGDLREYTKVIARAPAMDYKNEYWFNEINFADFKLGLDVQLDDSILSAAGFEFRATQEGDYYRFMIEQEYSTVAPGDWAWVARLDKFIAGEYFITLGLQDVTSIVAPFVAAESPVPLFMDAVGGSFKIWVDGDPVIDVTDTAPIEGHLGAGGALKLVTGTVSSAEFMNVYIGGNVRVVEGWLPVKEDFTQEEVKITARDTSDSGLDLAFGDNSVTADILLKESPFSMAGCEFRVTGEEGQEDYYRVTVGREYSTLAAGDWVWVVRMEKVTDGQYTTAEVLDEEDITSFVESMLVEGMFTTSLKIEAVSGVFTAWIAGAPVLEGNDADPIAQGAMRFVTGEISPAVFSNVRIDDSPVPEYDDPAYWRADQIAYWQVGAEGVTYYGWELSDVTSTVADTYLVDGEIIADMWIGDSLAAELDYEGLPGKAGIEFRITDSDDYYAFVVEEYTTGSWEARLDKFIGGVYSTTFASVQDVSIQENAWSTFRIDAEGGSFDISIGGVQVLSYTDLDPIRAGDGVRLIESPVLVPGLLDTSTVSEDHTAILGGYIPLSDEYWSPDVYRKTHCPAGDFGLDEELVGDCVIFQAMLGDSNDSTVGVEFGDHLAVIERGYDPTLGALTWFLKIKKLVDGEYITLASQTCGSNFYPDRWTQVKLTAEYDEELEETRVKFLAEQGETAPPFSLIFNITGILAEQELKLVTDADFSPEIREFSMFKYDGGTGYITDEQLLEGSGYDRYSVSDAEWREGEYFKLSEYFSPGTNNYDPNFSGYYWDFDPVEIDGVEYDKFVIFDGILQGQAIPQDVLFPPAAAVGYYDKASGETYSAVYDDFEFRTQLVFGAYGAMDVRFRDIGVVSAGYAGTDVKYTLNIRPGVTEDNEPGISFKLAKNWAETYAAYSNWTLYETGVLPFEQGEQEFIIKAVGNRIEVWYGGGKVIDYQDTNKPILNPGKFSILPYGSSAEFTMKDVVISPVSAEPYYWSDPAGEWTEVSGIPEYLWDIAADGKTLSFDGLDLASVDS